MEEQFKEVGTTGVLIARTCADYADSMSLLRDKGLRPMTYQEALVLIDEHPELKAQLKGTWFYLDGVGLMASDYYTFDSRGNLVKGKGELEKTVYAYPGKHPLSLIVNPGDGAGISERRFIIDAAFGAQFVAPVVVGVKICYEEATPKTYVNVLRKPKEESSPKPRTHEVKIKWMDEPENQ
jgi:hypothetical protein